MKRSPHTAQLAVAGMAALLLATFIACVSQVGGDVMATVDGRKILRPDVEKYYENAIASAQERPIGDQATILRLNILHQFIDDEILLHRAERLGLLATDDEVERKLNESKSPYSQDEFDKRLKEKKITLTDFKRDIRRSITVEKLMNKEISSKINVTDYDITNYFNATSRNSTWSSPDYTWRKS